VIVKSCFKNIRREDDPVVENDLPATLVSEQVALKENLRPLFSNPLFTAENDEYDDDNDEDDDEEDDGEDDD